MNGTFPIVIECPSAEYSSHVTLFVRFIKLQTRNNVTYTVVDEKIGKSAGYMPIIVSARDTITGKEIDNDELVDLVTIQSLADAIDMLMWAIANDSDISNDLQSKIQTTLEKGKIMTTATATVEKTKKSKRLDQAQLDEKCLELKSKYPHVVEGTLLNVGDSGIEKYSKKRTCQIACTHDGCDARRTIATSDLAQVSMCEMHVREVRKAKRKLQRQQKAAEMKAAKKAAKTEAEPVVEKAK